MVELDPDWGVIGLGIALQGPALRALEPLGVLDEVFERGYPYSELELYSGTGELLGVRPMPRLLGPDRPASCGIMRPALRSLLAAKLAALEVPVRLGVTVDALEDSAGGIEVAFSDGSSGRYDAVVGADGAFSRVRTFLFGDAGRPEFQGQLVWRALVPRGGVERLAAIYGARNTTGFNPVSRDEMYVFLVQNTPERVRLERDAVHAPPPHQASGASIALEDADLLAEAIAGSASVCETFARFVRRRWPRCRAVVEQSIAIGELQKRGQQTNAEAIARLTAATSALLAEDPRAAAPLG